MQENQPNDHNVLESTQPEAFLTTSRGYKLLGFLGGAMVAGSISGEAVPAMLTGIVTGEVAGIVHYYKQRAAGLGSNHSLNMRE